MTHGVGWELNPLLKCMRLLEYALVKVQVTNDVGKKRRKMAQGSIFYQSGKH